MTLGSTIVEQTYPGTGSVGPFSFSFEVQNASQVQVYLQTGITPPALTSDYTLTLNTTSAGGSITFGTAPASGFTIIIRRTPDYLQSLDIPLSALDERTLEQQIDKLTMQDQDLKDAVRRALTVPIGTSSGFSGTLPVASARADKALGFDGNGNVTLYPTTPITNTLITATGSSTARTLENRFAEVFNVKDYGAVGDGSTDDTAAITAAMAACTTAGRGVVYFPTGRYKTTGGHKPTDNMTFAGASMTASIVEFDDPNATNFCFWRASTDAAIENVTFQDLGFNGTWQTNQSENSNGYRFLRLYNVTNLNLINVRGTNSRNMAFTGVACKNVSVINCHVQNSTRDAFNFTDCSFVRFKGCSIWYCADDAFAVHLSSSAATPYRRGIIVEGCHVVDSYGIKLLGGKDVTVVGNNFLRPRGYAIIGSFNDATFNEGYSSGHSVTISGNTITDLINGTVFGTGVYKDAIQISSVAPSTGSGIVANRPGLNDAANENIVPLFPYLHTRGSNAADTTVLAGGHGVTVVGNTMVRTTDTTANEYTDLGWGNAFGKTGFYNPSLTSADLDFSGVRIDRGMRQALIANNNFLCGFYGVWIAARSAGTPLDFDFNNIVIQNNLFWRCTGNGFTTDFVADTHCGIVIKNNVFDIDPLHESANRDTVNKDGTWSATTQSFPCALNLVRLRGVTIGGNEYRNCLKTIHTSANTLYDIVSEETFRCKPVATGTSDSNIGIGVVLQSTPGRIRYLIEEGDPGSSDYGKALNICSTTASAMPTSGIYVVGHVVYLTTPVITNGQVLYAYERLTTGSSHTLGTDWAALYVRSKPTLVGTATWNPADLATASQQTTTVTVTGAALGDRVTVTFSLDLSGTTLQGYVSSANTVTVVQQNFTGGNVNLGSGTLTAYVDQT